MLLSFLTLLPRDQIRRVLFTPCKYSLYFFLLSKPFEEEEIEHTLSQLDKLKAMFLGSLIYFKQEVTMAGATGTHSIPDKLTSCNHPTPPQCRGAIIFCHRVTLSFT